MPYALICNEHLGLMEVVDYGGDLGKSSGKVPKSDGILRDTVAYECIDGRGERKGFFKEDLESVVQLTKNRRAPQNPLGFLRKLEEELKESKELREDIKIMNFEYFKLYIDKEFAVLTR